MPTFFKQCAGNGKRSQRCTARSNWTRSQLQTSATKAESFTALVDTKKRSHDTSEPWIGSKYVPAQMRIVEAYEQLRKYDEARAYVQRYEQTSGNVRPGMQLMARIYARTGKRREALEALRSFEKTDPPFGPEYALARIYSALGDRDRAIAKLEKMIQRRSDMPSIFVGPELDALRSDPRFQQLLRRANLPS